MLYPAATIGRVIVDHGGRTAALRLLRPLDLTRTPTLLLKGVRDRAARPNTIAPVHLRVLPPGDGLAAEYFDQPEFGGHSVKRVDPTINFRWGEGVPNPAIPADNFSVRWIGKIRAEYSEAYTFSTVTDDGVRLWVNDKKLIDEWHDSRPAEHAGTIRLEAGGVYTIWMEYFERTVTASAILSWSSPSVPRTVIPQAFLYSGLK